MSTHWEKIGFKPDTETDTMSDEVDTFDIEVQVGRGYNSYNKYDINKSSFVHRYSVAAA